MAKAFPEFDQSTLPSIPSHWVDESYSNDSCPCFFTGRVDGFKVRVFIDYANPVDREFADSQRFTVTYTEREFTNSEDEPQSFDDWNLAIGATLNPICSVWRVAEMLQESVSSHDRAIYREAFEALLIHERADNDAAGKPCPDFAAELDRLESMVRGAA
jgi:hypothetical protein